MKINIIHDKDLDAVKKLDLPIKKNVLLNNMMLWSEKTGQITCYIVVYDKHTQFMIKQQKEDKTYTNYFNNYEAIQNYYKALTR